MARIAHHPTLLLDTGSLGRATRQQLLGIRAPVYAVEQELEDELPAPNLALVDLDEPLDALRAQIDRLLSLPEIIANKNSDGPPRLHVYVIADLTDGAVAEKVGASVERLLTLIRGRYAPLFQNYREGPDSNFHCNPLLIVPGPGEPWPKQSVDLLAHLQRLQRDQGWPAAVNNIFVIGQSSGRYLLSSDDLGHMMATFLDLAIFGELPRTDAFSRLMQRGGDPYGTFVCATADFDEAVAKRFCGIETAIELMNWLRQTSSHRTDVAQRAAEVEELFDISRYRELVPLEKGDAALSSVIDSQCPDFSAAFREVSFFEDPDETLGHYSQSWFQRNRKRLEGAIRELGLFRTDEVIEEVEVNGAALVAEECARIDRFIDEKLEKPAEGNVADISLSLRHLRKRLTAEEEAVERRATAPLKRPPDLRRFDRAYRDFGKAVAEKPRRRRLLTWGVVATAVSAICLALLLRHLVKVLGLGPESTLRLLLEPPWAWLSAAAIAAAVIAVMLLLRVWRTATDIRRWVGHEERKGEMLEILENLSRGENNSLHAYYGSRFRRACDLWVHRTLLAVGKHVDDRLARISELLTTLELQVKQCKQLQRASGVRYTPDGELRTEAVLVDKSALRRSLVDPEELPRLAEERRKPEEIADVAVAFCREVEPFMRWAERLPFGDLEEVIETCEGYFPSLSAESVLLQTDLQDAAARRLKAFFDDYGRRLDFHLDFAGRMFVDADDLDRSLAQVVVGGAPVVDLVERGLEEAKGGDWQTLALDEVGNRVHLLRLVSGIAEAAIQWHVGEVVEPEVVVPEVVEPGAAMAEALREAEQPDSEESETVVQAESENGSGTGTGTGAGTLETGSSPESESEGGGE